MKNKIITFALVLSLVLSLSVTALAADITVPKVETDREHYFIYQNSNGVFLTCIDNVSKKDDKLYFIGSDSYKLVNNKWSLLSSSDREDYAVCSPTAWGYLYDTTGLVTVKGSVAFLTNIMFDDFQEYGSELVKQINVKTIVQVLVVGATAVVGLVFAWWGSRKMVRGLMSAFKKGKISL